MRLYRSGAEEKAFRIIVSTYKERLYWHIRRFTCSHEDTDDLLQDTFAKVWAALPSFREDAQLFTWIYRIATNEALNFLRRKKIRAMVSFEDIRIDCIGAERFAGYRLWREELAATLLRRGRHRACCIAALSSSSAFALWLHARVLAELQYEWAQNVLGELRERLAEHLPQPLMNRLEEDALGALRLQSTNDALELARAVVSCLKHFSDNEPSESDAPIRQQSACTGPLSKPQSKRLQQKNQESTFSPTKSTLKAFLKTISQESAHLENNSNFTPAETSGIEQQSSTNWLEGADFSQVQGISASPWPLKTGSKRLRSGRRRAGARPRLAQSVCSKRKRTVFSAIARKKHISRSCAAA